MVVHQLEAIEVEEQHAEILPVALRTLDLPLRRHHQVAGVVDLSHVVDERALFRMVVTFGVVQGQLGAARNELHPIDLVGTEAAPVLEDPEDSGLGVAAAHGDGECGSAIDSHLSQRVVEQPAGNDLDPLAHRVDGLLAHQHVAQGARLTLREATEGDALGHRNRGAAEQRQSALAGQRAQNQVERHRVDLAGIQTAHQGLARLHGVERIPQPLVLREQAAVSEQSLGDPVQLVGPDGLDQVVGRAHPQGSHGALHRGIAGEDYELGAGVTAAYALEQLDARQPRHREVGDHEVRRLAAQHLQRHFAVLAALDAHPRLEGLAHELARDPVVVDDDDASNLLRVGRHPPPAPPLSTSACRVAFLRISNPTENRHRLHPEAG